MHDAPKVQGWSRSRLADPPPLSLPRDQYAARRKRLLDALPLGEALLLPAAIERNRNADTGYRYRPDSAFWYLSGFAEPDSWLLLRKCAAGPSYILFVPPKDPEREVWTGIRAGVEGAVSDYGADAAFRVDHFEKELPALLEEVHSLHFDFGRWPDLEPKLFAVLNRLRTVRRPHQGPSRLIDTRELLAELRLRKDDAEVALIERGVVVTLEAHHAAMAQVRPGQREYEIEALLEYHFRKAGAWGHAYPSIVCAGANGCILHYHENDAVFRDGDLMLIDAGCEVEGYAIDVTRTSPVNGRFTDAQRELYEAVLEVQVAAIEAVRPGATIDSIHEGVLRGLCVALVRLGFLDGDPETLVAEKRFQRWYMHRTSHWLGLDVHDAGRYYRDGRSRPLEPGMLITIEPGLYVAPNDESAPERFRGMGIRIEDDVLVTADGYRNLTAGIAKTVAEIEALRR